MADSNTVLITKYSFGDDPNDPDAGEKIQTSDTIASLAAKTFPAGNGLTGTGCNWIEWSPMQKECLNIRVYWGKDDNMYMALNGPGFHNGMLQFADNGGNVGSNGVLEYCPGGNPDCSNPNTFTFTPDLMKSTAADYIAKGGSTANGWVRLSGRTGTGNPPWSKTDFSPYGTHPFWFGDDVPFCNKTDIKGDCMVGESTDYMTLDVTLCGNIYNWPDKPKAYDYSSYTVTSGSQATCDGLALGGGGECKNAISAELVFEDGTVLLPYPSGHLVTSECSECPSLESITPVVKEKCNGCLELDLGDGTETFTYGTLFGQEDLCDNSDSHGKEVTVRTNSKPSEPRLCHMYQTCYWTNTVDGVVDHTTGSHPSRNYIFTDNFAGNNETPPTNVKADHKYMLFTLIKKNLTVTPRGPSGGYGIPFPDITTTICYEYMGTYEQIPYTKDVGYNTSYYGDTELTKLKDYYTFQAENCCGTAG